MIKASELRIGNYYNHNGDYKKVNVNVIEELEISDRVWIKPIELTEEILLKCGFEKINRKIETQMSLSTFNWFDSSPDFIFIDIDGYNDMGIECKYLHQLQNTFHALTGKELEIQL